MIFKIKKTLFIQKLEPAFNVNVGRKMPTMLYCSTTLYHHNLFLTKMAKIATLFVTTTAENQEPITRSLQLP